MEKGAQRDKILHETTVKIRRKIQMEGKMLVNYQPLHASGGDFSEIPNFFRIIIANPEITTEHMDLFLNEIERIGETI